MHGRDTVDSAERAKARLRPTVPESRRSECASWSLAISLCASVAFGSGGTDSL